MDQRKLPNATISLVLGILSFIVCCTGIGSIILSGIALFLANKDRKTYAEAPEEYDNYKQVKTARTIAIIGLILGILFLIYWIYGIVDAGGIDGIREAYQKALEQAKQRQ